MPYQGALLRYVVETDFGVTPSTPTHHLRSAERFITLKGTSQ